MGDVTLKKYFIFKEPDRSGSGARRNEIGINRAHLLGSSRVNLAGEQAGIDSVTASAKR
jgi:hypothetical protein